MLTLVDQLLKDAVTPILRKHSYKKIRWAYVRINENGDQIGVHFDKRPSGDGYDSLLEIRCVFVPRLLREFRYRDVDGPYPLHMIHDGAWTWSPNPPNGFASKIPSWWNMLSPGIVETVEQFLRVTLVPLCDQLSDVGLLQQLEANEQSIPGRMSRDDLSIAFVAASGGAFDFARDLANKSSQSPPMREAAQWLLDRIGKAGPG